MLLDLLVLDAGGQGSRLNIFDSLFSLLLSKGKILLEVSLQYFSIFLKQILNCRDFCFELSQFVEVDSTNLLQSTNLSQYLCLLWVLHLLRILHKTLHSHFLSESLKS